MVFKGSAKLVLGRYVGISRLEVGWSVIPSLPSIESYICSYIRFLQDYSDFLTSVIIFQMSGSNFLISGHLSDLSVLLLLEKSRLPEKLFHNWTREQGEG